MSKHTPGPWEYSEGYVSATDNSDYIILAEVHSALGTDNFGEEPLMLGPEERIANARLIAAAPEMYELLTKIRGHIDSTCRECESKAIVPEIDALLGKIDGGGE